MPFTPRELTPPETLPAGARWSPPGMPPAPPGGGTGGPPGGRPPRRGDDDGQPRKPDLATELEPLLNDLAVPRVTFATLDLFPDDPKIQAELMAVVEGARGNLLRQLDALIERVATEQPPFTDDALRALQSSLLSSPRPFGTFSLILLRSCEALHAVPPREFALLVLDHFKSAASEDAHYRDRTVFDGEVHNDFMALLFAAQIASLER